MDRIKLLQNSLPVDRVAGRVVFGKADHWTPMGHKNEPYFDVQPAVRAFDGMGTDYSGLRMDALKIVGLAALGQGSSHRKWVARCDCGFYVFRRERAIRNFGCAESKVSCPRCTAKRKLNGF